MPRKDGTGPAGQGPGTGRGMGTCPTTIKKNKKPEDLPQKPVRRGKGRGRNRNR